MCQGITSLQRHLHTDYRLHMYRCTEQAGCNTPSERAGILWRLGHWLCVAHQCAWPVRGSAISQRASAAPSASAPSSVVI